jgi:hypothetical protein
MYFALLTLGYECLGNCPSDYLCSGYLETSTILQSTQRGLYRGTQKNDYVFFHGMWSFAGFTGALWFGMLALKLSPYRHFFDISCNCDFDDGSQL